jgi:adenylate cyclase
MNLKPLSDRQEVAVLVSGIRNYATVTENMADEEVVQMFDQYLQSMVDAVFKHGGSPEKYIIDAMRAVFSSPLPAENRAWYAVQTALEMRQRLQDFNAARPKAKPIEIGIGINFDIALSRQICINECMEFTVVGNGVNFASQLKDISEKYGCDIAIGESIFGHCKERIWYREIDRIRVQCKKEPIKIYELIGLRSEPIDDKKQQIIELYNLGREYYLNRKFTRAMNEFGTILEDIGKDKAAALYLGRCQKYLTTPPPENWDGVYGLPEA